MSHRRTVITLVAAIALAGSPLSAQTYRAGTTLPGDLTPVSAKAVAQRLLAVEKKGEFETWASFSARQRAAAPDLFSRPLVFNVKDPSCAYFFTQYNAEKQRFEVRWLVSLGGGSREREGFSAECEKQTGGNYTGSNAYGVQREVTVEHDTTYGVQWGASMFSARPEGEIRMAPADAEQVKPSLRAYAVGELREIPQIGFIQQVSRYFGPKIDLPRSTHREQYRVGLTNVTLIVVDERTRTILWSSRRPAKPMK